jgi:hypothetical protein
MALPSRTRIAVAVLCAFLVVSLLATPAWASSRPVGWYSGLPSGNSYYIGCGPTYGHTASVDLAWVVCNYNFSSGNNYQAWGAVSNTNFTKKVSASTGYVDFSGNVVRPFTASIDRTIGVETDSYFGAIAIGWCNVLPRMRLVYAGVANYGNGDWYCITT